MGVRAMMDGYLLWVASAVLLVLLLVRQLIRRRARRSAVRGGRALRATAPASSPISRSASELDTVSAVHELSPAWPSSAEDIRLRAEREAAIESDRAEADREAAEWEARLLAQQLADEERERARIAAELRENDEAQRFQAQRAAQAPPAVPAPRTPEQCLIMIADDSKVVRVKTSRLLARHLYRISLAEDGLDAARQIELDLPDVLITDVEMPGMDGFELTRQVRGNPRTAHIPIVMITADDVKHRADAIEAGVSVLLSKPYPEDHLLSYLQSTLTRAAAAP
ncbi:MAG: response regulator [Burkholderiales bacterium]